MSKKQLFDSSKEQSVSQQLQPGGISRSVRQKRAHNLRVLREEFGAKDVWIIRLGDYDLVKQVRPVIGLACETTQNVAADMLAHGDHRMATPAEVKKAKADQAEQAEAMHEAEMRRISNLGSIGRMLSDVAGEGRAEPPAEPKKEADAAG